MRGHSAPLQAIIRPDLIPNLEATNLIDIHTMLHGNDRSPPFSNLPFLFQEECLLLPALLQVYEPHQHGHAGETESEEEVEGQRVVARMRR